MDEERKEKYERYKRVVKVWEYEFRKKNNRIPSKYDIKDAAYNVKQAYKMYYRMKTSFLSETLLDVLDDDEEEKQKHDIEQQNSEDFLEVSQLSSAFVNESLVSESIHELLDPKNKLPNIYSRNQQNEIFQEYEAVEPTNNDKVWDKSLNKIKKNTSGYKLESKETIPIKSSRSKVELNFEKIQVKIPRNPKKGISKKNLTQDLNSNEDDKQNDSLPDLETILLEKSKRRLEEHKSDIVSNQEEIKTFVDTDWLNRNAPSVDQNISKNDNSTYVTSTYGISNLNIPSHNTTPLKLSVETCAIEAKYHSGNISDDEYVESRKVEKEEILPVSKKRRLSIDINETPNTTLSTQINNLSPIQEKENVKRAPEKPKRKTVQKSKPIISEEETKIPIHNFDTDDDDSDKDPDFKQKDCQQKSPSPVVMKRKRSIIKRSKEGITKATKKAAKILTRNKKNYKINASDDNLGVDKPVEEEEENINFFVDTDFNTIKCVPRASEKDIKISEKLFDSFVQQKDSQPSSTSESNNKITDHKTTAKKEALEKKIASGTLNDNYVRVNMKKKVFVRGKKAFNFSRYKKTLWKSKKNANSALDDMRGCDGGVLKCFNCGGVGHFAQQCKKKEDNLLPIDADVEESTLPTLQEAAQMASEQKLLAHSTKPDSIPMISNNLWKDMTDDLEKESDEIEEKHDKENSDINSIQQAQAPIVPKKSYIGHKIPEDFLQNSGILEISNKVDEIKPYLSLNADGSVPQKATKEVLKALKEFGHDSFRHGQENAIMRILCGLSTLVTLSTGSGKSLCYQLPAYLYRQKYNCLTLVISPLVSLMEDQVYGIPDFINAQCLHTNQTPKQREKVMNEIKNGRVEILLVSPEAVVSSEKSTGFGAILRQLPPIAFACIDEAHCVSQWSHNFRPSYLMICRVLRDKLGVKTVLGLTATATLQTRVNIIEHLAISDGFNGIISDIPLPDNLILTISKDENRDNALLELLKSERFESLQSIIIYCTRRDECERIAGYLRTCLQDNTKQEESNKKRKRTIWYAEAYHAGIVASRRRTIQKAFMCGELRIVVATIAFGMGINLSNIRGIIHFNMPKSFENYVQEVGRAGRDGKISHCHVFLNSKGEDLSELRRHIFANSIDRHVIRKLLQKIFIPCSCKNRLQQNEQNTERHENQRVCPGHEVCFSIEQTIQTLDIPEENIATLLCYLELHEERYIKVLGNAYTMCKIISYNGPAYMKQMAKTCPPLAMAIALELKRGKNPEDLGSIEFCVIDVASAIGWDSGVVKYQLKQLEWTSTNGFNKRSPLTVSFSDLGFRIRAPGDLSDEELDRALDSLESRTQSQERTQLIQLQMIFDSFMSLAFPSFSKCSTNDLSIKESDELKVIIRKYFQTNLPMDVEITDEIDNTSDDVIISNIRQIIQMYPENSFSGRSIARIFHGISSPCFPAVIWGRCKFWRAHLSVNFHRLVRLGNKEIVKIRSN
ncbi:hypothetical protein PVAND_011152 [Polypedilum vanderplanki]|uniref:DNA 3'-5' helicase n=1 Tax=Polypedilum vanderplanki TaxID=319348 RepID=A0A9J6CIQ2_POLVA|nr:hypothetical protein PVAND_011152 [Polypedilum vanderplanki]